MAERLTINDLDKVIVSLERAGFDKGLWDKLGRKLGLYPNTLGVISKDKGDVDSCFTECLSKWLKRADDVDDAGKPTWNSLADALGKVKDCKDQADYIRGLAQEGDAGALGKNNAKKRKIDTTKESSKDGGAQLNADDEDSDEPDAQASSLVPEESQVGRGTNRTTPEHHAATDSTDGPGPDLSLPVVSDIKGGGKVNYNDEVVYKMNTTPRGYCLIINMKKDRPKGNEKDVDKLKTLFKDSLQFAFKVYNDLKAEDIDNLMEIVKRDSHKLLCCFVMFILAHGGTEDRSAYFKTYDEEHYKVSRIKKKIESISYLNDKPKLLFIQSCRGGLLDTEVEVLDWDKIKTPSKIPRGSDFLTSFATIEDYPACRGEHGSRFIQCLCKVFTAYHDKCDVVTMMTMVTKEVAAIARDVGLEDGSTVCVRQNPETTFTFRKFLFFGKPPQWVNAHLSKK